MGVHGTSSCRIWQLKFPRFLFLSLWIQVACSTALFSEVRKLCPIQTQLRWLPTGPVEIGFASSAASSKSSFWYHLVEFAFCINAFHNFLKFSCCVSWHLISSFSFVSFICAPIVQHCCCIDHTIDCDRCRERGLHLRAPIRGCDVYSRIFPCNPISKFRNGIKNLRYACIVAHFHTTFRNQKYLPFAFYMKSRWFP